MSRRSHCKLSCCQGRILLRFLRQVKGGPTNVHIKIAVADSEYSPFPPRIQSGPRGHLPIVGIRTPIARLGYSPPLSRHTPTRPRFFTLLYVSFLYVKFRYIVVRIS
ncbi:unnamed protein product, partial [Callosobruchus maculatus]